ncbi:MAG: hypothetical protein DRJ64_06085, partial [Thermoprotei archaeon]
KDLELHLLRDHLEISLEKFIVLYNFSVKTIQKLDERRYRILYESFENTSTPDLMLEVVSKYFFKDKDDDRKYIINWNFYEKLREEFRGIFKHKDVLVIINNNKKMDEDIKIENDRLEWLYSEPKIGNLSSLEELKKIAETHKEVFYRGRNSVLKKMFKTHLPKNTHNVLVIYDQYDPIENEVKYLYALARFKDDKFNIVRFVGEILNPEVEKINFKRFLKNFWGFDEFRELEIISPVGSEERISQEDIIKFITSQFFEKSPRDVVVVAPTGWGKSLIYQIPAIYLHHRGKVTLVISPLKSLMKDQVENMRKQGIDFATFINSDVTSVERREIEAKVRDGKLSIILLSPEYISMKGIDKITETREIGMIVIDEAHLVTTWGKNFRVDYAYLGHEFPNKRKYPIVALSATLRWRSEYDDVEEIAQILSLKNPKIFYGNMKRENIKFEISCSDDFNDLSDKMERTCDFIMEKLRTREKGIVYTVYRRTARTIYEALDLSKHVGLYTGSMDREEREMMYRHFKEGSKRIMIATKAFGLGIDIEDIDFVYHHTVPYSLTDYVQEIGRAGRKGREVKAISFFKKTPEESFGEIGRSQKLAMLSLPSTWSIKLMASKLADKLKKHGQNYGKMSISLEEFEALFAKPSEDEDELIRLVKIGLWFIEKELERMKGVSLKKCNDKAQKTFVSFPNEYNMKMEPFKDVFVKIAESLTRYSLNSSKIVQKFPLYEVDLYALWECHFPNMTFDEVVYKLIHYPNELFDLPKLTVYYRYKVDLTRQREKVFKILKRFMDFSAFIASELPRNGINEEKFADFVKRKMTSVRIGIEDTEDFKEKVYIALKHLICSMNERKYGTIFLRRSNSNGTIIKPYPNFHSSLKMWMRNIEFLREYFGDEGSIESFIPYSEGWNDSPLIVLINIMNVLDIANLSFEGGKGRVINLRYQNKSKLIPILKDFEPSLLSKTRRRIKDEAEIMYNFMTMNISSEERWEFIKKYFVGGKI